MCNDQVIPRFCGYFFYACQNRCNKVRIQFMYDNANGICSLFAEIAGECIKLIS